MNGIDISAYNSDAAYASCVCIDTRRSVSAFVVY